MRKSHKVFTANPHTVEYLNGEIQARICSVSVDILHTIFGNLFPQILQVISQTGVIFNTSISNVNYVSLFSLLIKRQRYLNFYFDYIRK